MAASGEDLARHFFKSWNRGDVTELTSLCADGIGFDDRSVPDIRGTSDLGQYVTWTRKAFPGSQFDVEGIRDDGGHVAIRYRWRFREPDGGLVSRTGRAMLTCEGGRIVSGRMDWDGPGLGDSDGVVRPGW